MSNNPPVRILVLEDSEIDKRIIFSIIENSDLNFTTLIVDTREGFSKALVEFRPDVVLSDYVLPNFNGMQALEIHKSTLPDVPFIFVTGQLSEETAIDCLKHGAWDYIMKDHIKRLPVSIKNVLELKIERAANKQKEQLIKESEKRYKTLSELTFEGIVIHNNGVVKDCNLSFCRLFGYDMDELLGENVIDKLIYPEDKKTIVENAKHGITKPYESRGVRKDGSVFPIEQEAKVINYQGEEMRVVAMRDITTRKEAQDEIRLSEEKFQKISNAAKDAIILINHLGNVSFWNKGATTLFQYSKEEILGKNFHNLIVPKKYLDSHSKGFAHFLETGTGSAIGKILELEAIRKNGEVVDVELSLSAIKIHGHWNAVGIIRDISARKKIEAEMLAAQKHAQEMNEMKTNFLSNMSHELRTPLNGILGFAEILVESLEDEDFKDYASTILKSSERILNTFNLIIDLAVLDANKIAVNKKKEDLIPIIKSACEPYLSEAAEKHLFIKQNIKVTEAYAEIDQTLLTQALNNLLNNAIKYTATGGVTLSLNKVKVNGVESFALTISDTGIGIPEEKISLIYQAFRQVSEGYNRSFEGLGIGLYITKKYVDLLDAYIEMKSKVNQGTNFTIYIPVHRTDTFANGLPVLAEKIKAPPLADNTMASILYVEDDASHRQFVKLFLKGKYNVTCVESGEKALALVSEKQFDMIMMDINLGFGMNGLETVLEIRKNPDYTDVPIAAVTANALVTQKSEYLANGCTDYIAKPFRKQKLIDFIGEILRS